MVSKEVAKRFKQLVSPVMQATAKRDGWRIADQRRNNYLLAYRGELVARFKNIDGTLIVTVI